MTGLEKMKRQILDEAKASADSKLADAKRQAETILAAAKADAAKSVESISDQSDKDIAAYRDRVESSIDLQRRTKLLSAKQEVITEVLNKACERLGSLETDEYFKVIGDMVKKHVLPEEGIIYFSPADLERMPKGFEAELLAAAEEKGGKLVVSREGRKIENGFVLAYGGIEENCTLKAIFDARRDEMADKIHHLLFHA